MPLIKYKDYKPRAAAQAVIVIANEILEEYVEQGYRLTLRQLYYQMVARDYIPNNQKSYDRLGDIISSAREAGMIDWDHIEDRTRRLQTLPHFDGGKDFLESVAPKFGLDLWEGQPRRVMAFVEKEALAQIVEMACEPYDVPFLPNKGYLSASAAWNVGHNRMLQDPSCDSWVILHLGDHDPSGIDMSRDIAERVRTFTARYDKEEQNIQRVEVKRIALNMDQIEEYQPPPDPAKTTDSRFKDYQKKFGDESWELDALSPQVITDLIQENILKYLDQYLFEARKNEEAQIRQSLIEMAEDY